MQAAAPQLSRASKSHRAQRPGPGAGRGGRFGGRGPGGVASRGSSARLRGARRPHRRHFARRPRLGRWRPLCARREEGGRRRGWGEGRPPPAFLAAACVDAPGREASTSNANSAAGWDPAPQLGAGRDPRGHEASLHGRGCFSFSRVGASSKRPRGWSGFDLDRPLRRSRKPPWRPRPDSKRHTRALASPGLAPNRPLIAEPEARGPLLPPRWA